MKKRARKAVLAVSAGLSAWVLSSQVGAQQPMQPAPAAPARADPGAPPPPPGYAPPPPPGYAPPPPGYGPPPPGYGPPPPGYAPPPNYAGPPAYYYGAYPPPPEAHPMRRRSTAMMVTGIVLTGIGAIGLIGGAVLYADANNQSCVLYGASYYYGTTCGVNQSEQNAGVAMMIVGGVMAAAGIPLLIVGAHKVPAESEAQNSTLRLAVGPRAIGLRYSF